MRIINLVRKVLYGILVLVLTISVIGADSPPAVRAIGADPGMTSDLSGTVPFSNSIDPCLIKEVRITLASEQIHFCAPISQSYNVIKDNISDPNVSYAQLNQVNGYGIVNIKSVTPGHSPGIGRPVYNSGGGGKYRQAVWTEESSKTDRVVSVGPTGVFWDKTVAGIQIDASLPTALGILKVCSIEWYVERENRLWSFMLIWNIEIKNSNEWIETSRNFSIQVTGGAESTDMAIDLGTMILESKGASNNSGTGAPVDVGTPSWWDGACNDNNYFSATGVHSNLLGAAWHGVPACGPLTYKPPYSRHLVRFFTGAWGEYEFECVEMVMRFLYQEWGIAPWQGSANTIKNSPPASIEFFPNGTHAIVPGDIITEDGLTQNSSGHSMIITGVNLDGTGTGSISILEQNSSSGGSRSLHVTNWTVDPDPYTWGQTIQGWLHVKGNQDWPLTISGNAGIGNATLRFDKNGPQIITAASDGTYSLTVSYNWSGSVTPSLPGYIFLPLRIDYSNVQSSQTGQNYTAAVALQIYLPLMIR